MEKDIIFTGIRHLKDQKSLEVKEKIEKIAHLNTNVLIYGETGVGKDFWVYHLYQISGADKLLNLNCGDVPETLLESEWFGYKQGAFTGANRDYEGKWKHARDGILFLNQIDLLSINLQSRLLRIIERKKYFPLGSNQEQTIDARFIFSADSNIEDKVRSGEFRQDLFYRISAYKIHIPPLRERKKDILPLVLHFAKKAGLKVAISRKGIKRLKTYRWGGNIREIESFINNVSISRSELVDEDIYDLHLKAMDLLDTMKDSDLSLLQLEREYIFYLLKKYRSKVKVADILKISRKSLYNKLKKYEDH
ncbi:MAG: sigma-54-dependent Fis family transcriptional regulator [Candidatus Aminicenantes bacterium]|nr:sigma-54-dependent Fis family transcriptional regulator [Candidatus Aminicenantes bacterium]